MGGSFQICLATWHYLEFLNFRCPTIIFSSLKMMGCIVQLKGFLSHMTWAMLLCIMPSSHFTTQCVDFQDNIRGYVWGGLLIGSWKNRLLVTDELVEFEEQPVEVQDFREITGHSRGIYKIYPNPIKKNQKMSTCNWLDLETLGSQPISSTSLNDFGMTRWKSKKVALDTCCYMASHACRCNEHDASFFYFTLHRMSSMVDWSLSGWRVEHKEILWVL